MIRISVILSNLRRIARELRKNIVGVLAVVGSFIFFQIITGTGCWLKATTGFPCFGCGLTRAAGHLMKGDLHGSIAYHPLLIPLIFTAVVWLYVLCSHETHPKWFNNFLLAVFVLFMVTYIARLILYFPHTAPMDINERSILMQIMRFFGVQK